MVRGDKLAKGYNNFFAFSLIRHWNLKVIYYLPRLEQKQCYDLPENCAVRIFL